MAKRGLSKSESKETCYGRQGLKIRPGNGVGVIVGAKESLAHPNSEGEGRTDGQAKADRFSNCKK